MAPTAFFTYASIYIDGTSEMDPIVGSVTTGPNLTGGMEPGMNTNI